MTKRQRRRSTMQKRLLSAAMTVALITTLLPAAAYENGNMPNVKAAESVTLQNPRIVPDDSMEAGQRATWDCVWFGSYPQADELQCSAACAVEAGKSDWLDDKAKWDKYKKNVDNLQKNKGRYGLLKNTRPPGECYP